MMSDTRFRHSLPNHKYAARPPFNPTDSSPPNGIMKTDSQSGFTYRKPILINRPDFDSSSQDYSTYDHIDRNKRPRHIPVYPDSPVTPPSIASSSVLRRKYTMADYNSLNSVDILPNYDTQTTSSSHSVAASDVPRPPPHVPTSEYYKYTTPGLSPMQRTTQILVWLAEKSLDEEDIAAASQGQPLDEASKVIRDIKLKWIQDLKSNSLSLSVFNRPDNEEPPEEKENPINVANAEKLVDLDQKIKGFQSEIDDWKDFSDTVYQRHAEAKDKIQQETTIAYEDIDIETMVEHLDETQQDFYYEYLGNEDADGGESLAAKLTDIIDPGVTQIRQALNTANAFVAETHHFTKNRLSTLAKKVRDNSRIIPTDYDQTIPGVFEDDEEKKRQSELKNIQRMLQLSTRQHSSSSMDLDP